MDLNGLLDFFRAEKHQSDVPVLRSLGPTYSQDLHGRHASVLLQVLTDDSEGAAKNIALAGHYGSGKSSVILGVQSGLSKQNIDWVNLSLSSLGVDDRTRTRVKEDGSVPALTNLIQKEIVKQLLYRKAPSAMPGSRYFRIDSFRTWPAFAWSVAVGAAFIVLAVLFGLVDRVEQVAPQKVIDGHDKAAWLVVAFLGLFVGAVWFLGQRTMQNRVRVESLSAGGAAVSLRAKENSYFDEYLDEIVYFFQKTNTSVAIFEDLDRFRDPHIFETLRELNTVLNNSEQVRSRPVRFVYAVRDSIFEQLEDLQTGDEEPDQALVRASTLEVGPAANRTKFFDLVVPMVPFITHRSARDLLVEEFKDSPTPPSRELVNLVGAELTDMRLIRNIRNEFEIYRASILGAKGLKGLTADKLFAMMVYKNLHLDDFEAVRLGTSQIDRAYDAYREMVKYQVGYQASLSKAYLDRVSSGAAWERRAKAAGQRLAIVLPLLHRGSRRGGEPMLVVQGTAHSLGALESPDLWRSMFEQREDVSLGVPGSGYPMTRLTFDELLSLVGGSPAMDKDVVVDIERQKRLSRLALETKDMVSRATMSDLIARTDLTMPISDQELCLEEIVADLVTPLVADLLAKGHIDENFTLYCSDYHAIAISVSAMNFILHCVQESRADFHFHFDGPESIVAVEKEMKERFLENECVFNVEVFDHYLASSPNTVESALDRLVARAATDTSFINAYLGAAKDAQLLVTAVAGRWSGVFIHLLESDAVVEDDRVALMDAALRTAADTVEYESSEGLAEFITANFRDMPQFTRAVDAATAATLAGLLRRFGVAIPALADLGREQMVAVVEEHLYPVTRENLETALSDGASLSLDAVSASAPSVYQHLLSDLDGYLGLLTCDEHSVGDAGEFVAVLNDVAGIDADYVERVASLSAPDCEIDDLTELVGEGWPGVVAANRLSMSVANLKEFIAGFGVSIELAGALAVRTLHGVTDVTDEERMALSYEIANAPSLSSSERVHVLNELSLSRPLDGNELNSIGLGALSEFVAAGLIADDAATYDLISADEYALRENYFASSPGLAAYVRELDLTNDDLSRMMKSSRLKPAVKQALAGDASYLNGRVGRTGAISIAEWAGKGNEIAEDVLLVLAQAGAPPAMVLDLLTPHLSALEIGDLHAVLVALGDEYEPLTRPGRHRPRLKERDGTVELLEQLQRRGHVSSFSTGSFLGGIKVNMRR